MPDSFLNGIQTPGPWVDKETPAPICAPSCTFGGCYRCQDAPGKGSIKGTVYDVLFRQVVPGARVSLMYKGVKVNEAFTDQNGKFVLESLNNHLGCDVYRIVVDMYQDNVCTGPSHPGVSCASGKTPPWTYPYNMDEGIQGGYIPYTSGVFSVAAGAPNYYKGLVFNMDIIDPDSVVIDLYPKSEPGKAYATINWLGANDNGLTFHAVLPKKSAFTAKEKDIQKCTYGAPATVDNTLYGCSRDVTWQTPGSWDIDNSLPYTHLICLHNPGEKTFGASDDKYNDCPVEGTDACKKSGRSDADCGLSVGKECSKTGKWESCFNERSGPLTIWMNYAALAGLGENIGLYYGGFTNEGSTDITSMLKGKSKYKATVVIGNDVSEFTLPQEAAAGTYWHLGDINQDSGTFIKANAMVGSDSQGMPPTIKGGRINELDRPAPGLSCYDWLYQCNNSDQCIDDKTKLPISRYGCGKGCSAGSKCLPWTPFDAFEKYNW